MLEKHQPITRAFVSMRSSTSSAQENRSCHVRNMCLPFLSRRLRVVSMSADMGADADAVEKSVELLEDIVSLRGTLTAADESINGFRQTVAGLPSMTSELNREKRAVVSVLNRLLAEFNNGQTLLRGAETVLHDMSSN